MSSTHTQLLRGIDLFSGAGGASMGYHRAGFDMTGVDIEPQPRYPFEFVLADALEYVAEYGHLYDFIHASPPCQAFSDLRHLSKAQRTADGEEYPDLIDATRKLLRASGKPYVIENVRGAPLESPVVLCGSQFGNDMLKRHRLFESNLLLYANPCDHSIYSPRFPALRTDRAAAGKMASVVGVFGYGGGSAKHQGLWSEAMQIEWMNKRELSQAIPPAYTEFIGEQLMWHLEGAA